VRRLVPGPVGSAVGRPGTGQRRGPSARSTGPVVRGDEATLRLPSDTPPTCFPPAVSLRPTGLPRSGGRNCDCCVDTLKIGNSTARPEGLRHNCGEWWGKLGGLVGQWMWPLAFRDVDSRPANPRRLGPVSPMPVAGVGVTASPGPGCSPVELTRIRGRTVAVGDCPRRDFSSCAFCYGRHDRRAFHSE